MIIPDHLALVIFCTATNATLPAGQTREVQPVHVEELPGAVGLPVPERNDKEDQAEQRCSRRPRRGRVVLAGDRTLDEALVERDGSSRPLPGRSGGARPRRNPHRGARRLGAERRLALELPDVVHDGPAVAGQVDLVAIARHDAAAVADDAVDVAVGVPARPPGEQGRRADPGETGPFASPADPWQTAQ